MKTPRVVVPIATPLSSFADELVTTTGAPSTRRPCVSNTLTVITAVPPGRRTFGLAVTTTWKPDAELGCVLVPRFGPSQLMRARPRIRTRGTARQGVLCIGFPSIARGLAWELRDLPRAPPAPPPTARRSRPPRGRAP